ncbi:MAG: aldo/keto reductase [Bacteroidales bacterium]|nr:aldo/keto reductase [Bacteroidales bacterium]
MTDIQGTWKLKNGVEMPYFGLGVFLVKDGDEVINSVKFALDAGYRHIDTAALYQNEKGVGEAIKQHPIDRKDIFVTSKVWNSDQGYDKTLYAFDNSLEKLGFDYLDLYLVHWPVKTKYKDTWRALEYLYKQGRVKAIGVSNFLKNQLEDLLGSVEIVPMVNQMEFHPYLVQQQLIDFCNEKNIQYEAWSPLMQGKIFKINEFSNMAKKYNKTIAQLILRWNLQKGVITIPKSIKQERIISNAQIFDFTISDEDMKIIDRQDKNHRVGADPDNFNF